MINKGDFFKKSFTLMEITFVIVIATILLGIAMVSAWTFIEKSKIVQVVSDAQTVKEGAIAMVDDTGMWPGSNWNDDPTDPLGGAAPGEGFVYKGNDPNMSSKWNGPYLEKWPKNPWQGWYFWDYNEQDQNGDGIGHEHVLWIDNSGVSADKSNSGVAILNTNRILLKTRQKIDAKVDDGNLTTGRVQVWQGDTTHGNFGWIIIQGP